jgi:hypothetical protein
MIANIDSREELESIVQLLASAGIATDFNYLQRTSNKFMTYYNYIRVKLKDCRNTIDCLYTNRLISPGDRADIEGDIRSVEKTLHEKSKFTPTITNPQADILRDLFADPYIGDILEITTNLKDYLFCLNIATADFPTWPNSDDNIRVHLKSIFDKMHKAQQERLIGAIKAISKCYWGKANLESAMTQSGVGIPTIDLQRKVILIYAKEKMQEKYSDLDNDLRFLAIFKMNILLLGHQIGLFGDPTTNIIKMVLDQMEVHKFVLYPDDFIKALIRTENELDISFNELSIHLRSSLSKLLNASLKSLEDTGRIQVLLNSAEIEFCRKTSEQLDPNVHKNKLSESADFHHQRYDLHKKTEEKIRGKLQGELKRYQGEIQSGALLGKEGLLARRKKLGEAEEDSVKQGPGSPYKKK